MFSVVEFSATETRPAESAVVPRSWMLDKNKCAWPPSLDPTAAARNSHKPVDNKGKLKQGWKTYDYRILKSFDSYEAARKKLDISEFTSDLSDTGELQSDTRKKRPNRRYEPSSTDEESESLPAPPKIIRTTLSQSPDSDDSDENFGLVLVNHTSQIPVTVDKPKPSNRSEVVTPKRTRLNFETNHESTTEWTVKSLGEYVVKGFTILNERQKQIDEKLSILLANRDRHMIHLPLQLFEKASDIATCDELELKLTDEEFRQSAIAKLLELGGNSCYETVRGIMTALWTEDLLRQFSLHGRKGKRPYLQTQAYQLVLYCAKLNMRVKMDDAEIRKAISSVFRHT